MKLCINTTGLILDFIGATIIFYSSPSYFMTIDGGSFDGTPTPEELKKRKKEKLMKKGFALLAIGFLLQLLSNFL